MAPPSSSSLPNYYAAPRGFPQAIVVMVPWQRMTLIASIVALAIAAFFSGYYLLLVINSVLTTLYLVTTLYRVLLIDLSLRQSRELIIEPEALLAPPADAADWPRYVIILPLYHEATVLPTLVEALRRFDYPPQCLDIRLLIESDDSETLAMAQSMNLQPPFHIEHIPVSYPRTKPKACNVALFSVSGDYLVIYDAEDRPEPDQLKKAAVAFSRVPANVACIQAKLNFYNPRRNFLTRCFTSEYAMWFDLCLPGLDYLRAPIPLGGTSNHFRLDVLKSLGGWDEYNVTEDCDLGLRLFSRGWRTRILDSTTWEQACPSLSNWIRQRSRWVKGYVQTWLVHMRSPLQLWKDIGTVNWLHMQLLVGSAALCQFINPFYWALALLWIVLRPAGVNVFFPHIIFAMAATCLFVGNFIFVYCAAVACVRRGFGSLAKYTLGIPVYWVLMSIATWKGVLQLINKPHHWEKTQHFADD